MLRLPTRVDALSENTVDSGAIILHVLLISG
jgi:hypothetical protein